MNCNSTIKELLKSYNVSELVEEIEKAAAEQEKDDKIAEARTEIVKATIEYAMALGIIVLDNNEFAAAVHALEKGLEEIEDELLSEVRVLESVLDVVDNKQEEKPMTFSSLNAFLESLSS